MSWVRFSLAESWMHTTEKSYTRTLRPSCASWFPMVVSIGSTHDFNEIKLSPQPHTDLIIHQTKTDH